MRATFSFLFYNNFSYNKYYALPAVQRGVLMRMTYIEMNIIMNIYINAPLGYYNDQGP